MNPVTLPHVRRTRVQSDILGLSSGTIATLVGSSNCMTIDSIQETFYHWVVQRDGVVQEDGRESAFETWQVAWEVFKVDISETLQYIRKYTEGKLWQKSDGNS
jgi:hypothetical protein